MSYHAEYTFKIPPYYVMYVFRYGSVKIISNSKRLKGKELAMWNKKGYLETEINGKLFFIHTLVAKYSIGERPPGLVINHKDGNKLNNHPSNLEYITTQQNTKHAVRLGLHSTCNKYNIDERISKYLAKIDDLQAKVLELRQLKKAS